MGPSTVPLLLMFAAILLVVEWAHAAVIDSGDDLMLENQPDYDMDPEAIHLRAEAQKPITKRVIRSACVQKGEYCDHNPKGCCPYLECRCNFWGTNCQCQTGSIF